MKVRMLKRAYILKIVIVMLLLLGSAIFLDRAKAAEVILDVKFCQTEARAMLDRINSFRTGDEAWYWDQYDSEKIWEKDLSELRYDYELEKAAKQRAIELVFKFAHERPDNRSSVTALRDIGYSWEIAYGENIATGHNTEQEVFEGWKEDDKNFFNQGHRRNMLSPKFNAIGIACVEVGGVKCWVQEFSGNIPSQDVTPADDSVAEVRIDIDENRLYKVWACPDIDVIMGVDLKSSSAKKLKEALLVDKGSVISFPDIKWSIEVRDSNIMIPVKNIPDNISADGKYVSVSEDGIKGLKVGEGSLTYTLFGKTDTVKVLVRKTGDPDPRLPEDQITSVNNHSSYWRAMGLNIRTKYVVYQSSKKTIQVLYEEGGDESTTSVSSALDFSGFASSFTPDIEVYGELRYNSWYLVTSSDEIQLTDLYSDDGEVYLPDSVYEGSRCYNVTSIGANAVTKCQLKSIELGNKVKVIEENAFKGQKKLKSVTIYGEELKKIGKNAFADISKNTVFTIVGTKAQFVKVKRLLIASGVSRKNTFKRVEDDSLLLS